MLTQARLSGRCRHRPDPAPQKTPRRKFVASVTFLSFKSRERWHDPPCKRTAMRPVHWSAAQVVVVAPRKDATMKIPGMKYGAGRGPGRSAGVAVAVLLAAGRGGWGGGPPPRRTPRGG